MQKSNRPAPSGNQKHNIKKQRHKMTATPTPKIRLKSSVDSMFLILIILLLCIGTIMICSASYAYAQNEFDGDSFHYVREQAFFVVFGLVVMFGVSLVDYMVVRKLQHILFWGSFVLLLLVFVPGIGSSSNGATRWINIGFRFQPSELMKTALILYFADYNITHRNRDNWYAKKFYAWFYPYCKTSRFAFLRNHTPPKNRMKTFWTGIFPYLLFLGAMAVILKRQPHMSCLIIIGIETIIMMILGQCSFKWMAGGGLPVALGGAGLLLGSAHSRQRLMT